MKNISITLLFIISAIAFDPPNSNSASPYHPCSDASLINSNVNDSASTASTEEVPALMKEVDGGYVIANYYYFWNLNSYYPTNSIGECSWVAATMYLTYLNAFYSQTISEEYIIRPSSTSSDIETFTESPGIWDGTDIGQVSDGKSNFYERFVNTYKSDIFTYPVLEYMPTFFGNYSRQADLIDQYLSDLNYVKGTDYTISEIYSTLDMTSVYNQIITFLQSGDPVIANTPNHSFIVYGYVPGTRKLIVHNGWRGNSTHMYFDVDNNDSYPGIQYIIRPIFLSHSHNYLYVNSNTSTAYCTCGDSVYTQPYYHKHLMTLTGTGKHKKFVCSICNFTEVH